MSEYALYLLLRIYYSWTEGSVHINHSTGTGKTTLRCIALNANMIKLQRTIIKWVSMPSI